MNTRQLARLALGIILAAWSPAVLTGCSASAPVSGKVIQGPIPFVGVVDSADERLTTDGIPDVTLTAMSGLDKGGFEVGRTTSDAKGGFRLMIKNQSAFIRPAEFAASKDGFVRSAGVMSVPPPDRRLLVILKPTSTATQSGSR